jgi:hypothetical protein
VLDVKGIRCGQTCGHYDGELPAWLNPHRASAALGFQRFDNLLANVRTRPGPDNRQQKGQPMASRVTAWCQRQGTRNAKEQEQP